MIGLLLGFGLPGEGFCAIILGSALAICALCGINKCMRCRMRDCGCLKRCLRAMGSDKFDDFDMMMHVHEALYTPSKGKLTTMVKVTAGPHVVKTDESSKGIYQETLQVFVEQGTDEIIIELLDSRERKVLATLRLDTMKDLLQAKGPITEKMFTMKQKSKGVLNPRIKLTCIPHGEDEVEKGLLANIGQITSSETGLMLRQQLAKASLAQASSDEYAPRASRAGPASELGLLATGCAGPLDMFGSWGSREQVYVAVRGPPDVKRYVVGVWKDKTDCDKNGKAQVEIDLLKVLSVQPDPGRSEVFMIQYIDADKVKQRLQFRRLDRARDVWVEMLQLLIKHVHEKRDTKKKHMSLKG